MKMLNQEYRDYLKYSKDVPSLFDLLKSYKVFAEEQDINIDKLKKIEKYMDVKKVEQAYNTYIKKLDELRKVKKELQNDRKYLKKIKKELVNNLEERKLDKTRLK